jgi:hypothetical protein
MFNATIVTSNGLSHLVLNVGGFQTDRDTLHLETAVGFSLVNRSLVPLVNFERIVKAVGEPLLSIVTEDGESVPAA